MPAIFVGQYSSAGFTTQGTDPYGNYRLGQDTGQLTVTFDKVHGPHELKFGFDGRIHQMNYIQTNAPVGIFSFDNSGSAACPGVNDANYGQTGFEFCGGDPMASFLMGTMTRRLAYYEIQFRPATTNYQYGILWPGQLEGQSEADVEPRPAIRRHAAAHGSLQPAELV